MSYLVNPYMVSATSTFDTTDLKFYAQWEETSGNIVNQSPSSESLGSSADITISGATYRQTGIIEKCLSFDGTNDFGEFGDGDSKGDWSFFHGTGDWSVNFWINITTYDNEARFFDNLSGTETSGVTLRLGGSTSTLGIAVCNASGQFMANGDFSLDEALTTSEWHMITFTCDYSDASDCYECFVDGQPQDTVARSYAGSTSTPAVSLKTMSRDNGANNFLDGLQDETALFSRLLGSDEILNLFNSGGALPLI